MGRGKRKHKIISSSEHSQECEIMDRARNRFSVPVDDTFSYRRTHFWMD